MEEKVQKNSFVFEIISYEWIALIIPSKEKNTCDGQ